MLYPNRFANVAELEIALHGYTHYYNKLRIKPTLNDLSPVQYRAQYLPSSYPRILGRLKLTALLSIMFNAIHLKADKFLHLYDLDNA
ncbi:IS3 family transposase [Pasteurella langaaensis]|uniref:IS3 family transposase n=1 Tax=Alitibacter langaaensis TaxID=756 RepID=UPI000E30B1F5